MLNKILNLLVRNDKYFYYYDRSVLNNIHILVNNIKRLLNESIQLTMTGHVQSFIKLVQVFLLNKMRTYRKQLLIIIKFLLMSFIENFRI